MGIPNDNIPVYRVQKESAASCIKTLHSNMLLPISVMPSVSEVQIKNPKQKRTRQERPTQIHHSDEESETDQSDIIVHFPRKYVVPQRMNDTYGGRTLSSNPPMSDLTSSRHLSSVPVSPPVNESDVMSSQSRDQSAADRSMSYKNRSLQNIRRPSTVNATPPRRSGRVRVPPNRYGAWVMNQNIVEDSDLREYFV